MARQWIKVYVHSDDEAEALLNALSEVKSTRIASLEWDGYLDLHESQCAICGAIDHHDLSLDYDHDYKEKEGYSPLAG